MNKVILLVLLMPVTASGQIVENINQDSHPGIFHKSVADSIVRKAFPGDVVISEIMADPSPVVDLPDREYVEIYNRTQNPVRLDNWILSDGNSRSTFPETIIPQGSYMILCQLQDTLLFKKYGLTTGLKSFPALTNSGKVLFISDSSGSLIHGVEYSSGWYGDILKSGGGWSMEMIDTDYPFYQKGNWHASVSANGGTPGKINSVSAFNPDTYFSGIENVFPSDSITITIRFSETIQLIDSDNGKIYVDGLEIINIVPSDHLMTTYTGTTATPLKSGRIYTLSAGDSVTDFAKNLPRRYEFSFGIPEKVRKGDIQFNELLFNPLSDESDYIEFHNCSDKITDASDLVLVSVNDKSHDTSSVVFVSAEKRCFLPRNYNVITTDRESLLARFYSSYPDNVFEISYLPSMPDDEGHLILFSRSMEKIDEVFYNSDMHFSLLSGFEGISLEKIRTCSQSTDNSLWHSASESSGWGTPGAPNSVLMLHSENKDIVTLSSTKITPDNDGNEDYLVIDLKLSGYGNVVSVKVFDEAGSFVSRIADNLLSGPEASIVWDGTYENGRLVNTGIYILLISIFDEKGKIESFKRVCSVLRR